MKTPLVLAGAALLAGLACAPALDCGFLADDYVFGSRNHAFQSEDPGLLTAFRTAFTETWSEELEVFRPLTVLSLQLDWALLGPDGRLHHLQSLLLWLLAALVFSDLAARVTGVRDPWFRGLALAVFGTCPAAVEALGWIVGRGEILRLVFSLLAVRVLFRTPERPLRAAPWVLAALLSYEQAVTLPFVLVLVDARLGPRPPAGTGAGAALARLLRRHAASLAVLGLYLLARGLVFGRVGSSYLDRPYLDYVATPEDWARALANLGVSLLRMVAPLSEVQVERLVGGPAAAFPLLAAFLLVPPAWLLVRATLRRRAHAEGPTLGRFAPVAVGWIALGVVLVVPIHRVAPSLLQSRWLGFSAAGWLLLLCVAATRGGGRGALCALVLLQGVAMRVDLQAWVRATHQADLVLAPLQEPMASGRVAVFGLDRDRESIRTRTEVTETDGVFGLSFGIFHATRPPFVTHEGTTVFMLRRGERHRLAAVLDGIGRGGGRAALARIDVGEDGFARTTMLAPGGAIAPRPGLRPEHGARIPRVPFPVFHVRGKRPEAEVDAVRVVIVDAVGLRLEATATPEAAGWKEKGRRYAFTIEGRHFAPPLPATVLATHPAPALLWWAELLADGRCVARAPFAVLDLE